MEKAAYNIKAKITCHARIFDQSFYRKQQFLKQHTCLISVKRHIKVESNSHALHAQWSHYWLLAAFSLKIWKHDLNRIRDTSWTWCRSMMHLHKPSLTAFKNSLRPCKYWVRRIKVPFRDINTHSMFSFIICLSQRKIKEVNFEGLPYFTIC